MFGLPVFMSKEEWVMARDRDDILYAESDLPYTSRIRWGPIIAGVIIALVTQGLLTLFGLAVGLTALNPMQQADYSGFGIGSGIWLIVSSLISVFVGAWSASWLANILHRPDGVVHGILTWGLYMVLTLFLIGTGIGNIMGGAFSLLNSAVTGASQGVASNVDSPREVSTIQQRVQQMAGNQEQEQATSPGERLAAERQAEQVSDVASRIAWTAFLATLLSLIAGAVGGLTGIGNRYARRTTEL
jgi:hypothetical protein